MKNTISISAAISTGKKTAPKKASIRSPLWVGLGAGEVGRYGEDAEWALDQREDDGGSLVFTSPPITKPFEILGAPQASPRIFLGQAPGPGLRASQ